MNCFCLLIESHAHLRRFSVWKVLSPRLSLFACARKRRCSGLQRLRQWYDLNCTRPPFCPYYKALSQVTALGDQTVLKSMHTLREKDQYSNRVHLCLQRQACMRFAG